MTAGLDPAVADALMVRALDEARAALAHDDVPIGAVVARLADGEIVASAHNERERQGDPTAHAEVLALRAASAATGGWRLHGHVLVSTIEPCPMCAGAAWAARVDLIVFGAADPRAGATGSLYNFAADPRLNHEIAVIPGVRAEECARLVAGFFETRRAASEARGDGRAVP
jgi:tRNA(adenine34) deaminase